MATKPRFNHAQALEIVSMKDDQHMSFRDIAAHYNAAVSTVYDTYKRVKADQYPEPDPEEQEHEFLVSDAIEGMEIPETVTATQQGPNKVGLKYGGDKKAKGKPPLIDDDYPLLYTIEDLLEFCKVDPEVWVATGETIKAYPGWRSNIDKDLTYVDGKVTGHVRDQGDITRKQLVSLSVTLVRKNPIALSPVITPVSPLQVYVTPEPKPLEDEIIYTSLVAADFQVGFKRKVHGTSLTPFHDRRALDLVVQMADVIKPDRIDLLGDLIDLPEWSTRFLKHPEFYWTTQPAVYELHHWLALIRQTNPFTPIQIFQGNHEKRMPDATMTHLTAAYDLKPADGDLPVLSLEFLLGLEGLGIEWLGGYPNNIDWLGNGVIICHGNKVRSLPGDTAKAVAQGSNVTVVYGHAHKLEYIGWIHRGPYGEFYVDAHCPGCICRTDYQVPGHDQGQIWRQGLSKIDYMLSGYHHITPIPIRDGQAIYDGKLYQARQESTEALYDLYPGWEWIKKDPEVEYWE